MHDLITIAPPDPEFGREFLDSPGGFLWWYADLLDAQRSGLVLIWAFGLPFLPGYADRHRHGRSQHPRNRPSLNIAVYEKGELACYLLQEFAAEDAQWQGTSWRFGDSRIEERIRDGRLELDVHLDCPIPGSDERLRGEVVIEGPARLRAAGDRTAGHHDWSPLVGPSSGRWSLSAGSARYAGTGRAYHDCNAGRGSLEDAGLYEWTWGRLPFAHVEVLYYIAWDEADAAPQAIGVSIDTEGGTKRVPLEVTVERWSRARAGMRYPGRLALQVGDAPWMRVRVEEIVDDGPFYLRYFIEGDDGTDTAVGFGEICRPDRIDLDLHRPLVRMRVHRVNGPNSVWLPLFSGPREGRVRRLVGQLTRSR